VVVQSKPLSTETLSLTSGVLLLLLLLTLML
jgi:hypothetical protein